MTAPGDTVPRDASGNPIEPARLRGQLRIRSPLSMQEARKRLYDGVQRLHWHTLFGTTGLAGTLRNDAVRLVWHSPMFGNAFKPVLVATLAADGRGSVLAGRFRLHPLVVSFMVFWCGFLALQLVLAVAAGAGPALAGIDVLLLVLGLVVMQAGRLLSRRDRVRIAAALCDALDGTLDAGDRSPSTTST